MSSRLARVHVGPGVLLGGTLLIAVALRYALLGQNSLSFDEAFVAWVAGHRWQDLLLLVRGLDFHPPGYYVLAKAWIGLAGAGEAALRIPSAGLSSLCVLLTYLVARRVCSEATSLLGAFLVAVSPLEIMAGQEARMYPLLETLVLASTLVLVASVERGGWLRWGGYSLLVAAAAYTQYMACLVFAGHGIWVACAQRRSLGRWLAASFVAAALFAPWVPSLWHQTTYQSVRSWLLDRPAYPDLDGLLGLWSFGGSLFGMTSYFLPGSLGLFEQFLALLPFLVVLWWGVISFGSDRRGLALLGLSPAVTVAVMLTLAFGKPIVYPRGFSFLHPFYAVFLARGVLEIADRLRLPRERTVAFLTAGLLLYSLPVLDHYYADPGFRPYQWRTAAAAVRARVRPGDFFLYVGREAEIPFGYYFREPHPSMTVVAAEALPGSGHVPTFAQDQAQALAARFPRVWLIGAASFHAQVEQRLLPALSRAFHIAGMRDFAGTRVYLLEVTRPQGR